MMKQMRLATAFAMATALVSPALAEGETAETVVATVNGTQITLGQMIALRESLPPQYQSLPEDVLFKGIMDQLVQQEVLRQSVTELSARDRATLENDTRGYVSGIAIQAIVEAAVTDEALQAAYDARFQGQPQATEYNAAHILVETEEEATTLKAQLAGGADFATLAQEHSIDPGSGSRGGDLGWFGVGMMVKPFEDAVVGATLGEVAGPIQTDFGWHLVLVKESRLMDHPTLDDIRDDLATEIENAAIEAKIAELQSSATITREGEAIDPAILKNSVLID